MAMGRQAAKRLAISETLTIGKLREMIDRGKDDVGPSRINQALPRAKVAEIFLGALSGRPDDEVPRAWRPDLYSSRPGAVKPSKDQLIISNILREFGP